MYSNITFHQGFLHLDKLECHALYKTLSYFVVTYFTKKVLKADKSLQRPFDMFVFAIFGIVVSIINTITSMTVLLNIKINFSREFMINAVLWVAGDLIGQIILMPFIILILYPYVYQLKVKKILNKPLIVIKQVIFDVKKFFVRKVNHKSILSVMTHSVFLIILSGFAISYWNYSYR